MIETVAQPYVFRAPDDVAGVIVDAGRIEVPMTRYDPEYHAHYTVTSAFHVVSFSTPYGVEYTHTHAFPDDAEGARRAAAFAARVQAALDAKGLAGIDETHWAQRVIYGSDAYCAEAPFEVQREKEDAMFGFS